MNGWEIAVIVYLCLGVGVHLAKHGETKTGNYSFPIALVSVGIWILLLIKGGFF